MDRCKYCPVPADRDCLAVMSRNARLCRKTDPDDRIYDPAYRDVLVGHEERVAAMSVSPPSPVEPPSYPSRVASFVGAVAGHIAAGAPTVSAEVKESRLAICRTNECGHYRAADSGPACLACGCGQRGLELKTSWADQRCPLDPPRWGSVDHRSVEVNDPSAQ